LFILNNRFVRLCEEFEGGRMEQLKTLEELCMRFDKRLHSALHVLHKAGVYAANKWYESFHRANGSQGQIKICAGVKEFYTKTDQEIQDMVVRLMAAEDQGVRFIGEEKSLDPGLSQYMINPQTLDQLPSRALALDPVDGSIMFMAKNPNWGISLGQTIGKNLDWGMTWFPVFGLGQFCISDAKTKQLMWARYNSKDHRLRSGYSIELLPVTKGPGQALPFIKTGWKMPQRPIFWEYLRGMEGECIRMPSAPVSIGLAEVACGQIDGYIDGPVKLVDVVAGLSHVWAARKHYRLYTMDSQGCPTRLRHLTLDCLKEEKIVCFWAGNDLGMRTLESFWQWNMPKFN
jgi:fructose-1,6-bisphosphatase/inositol monophosphatase family enzyme